MPRDNEPDYPPKDSSSFIEFAKELTAVLLAEYEKRRLQPKPPNDFSPAILPFTRINGRFELPIARLMRIDRIHLTGFQSDCLVRLVLAGDFTTDMQDAWNSPDWIPAYLLEGFDFRRVISPHGALCIESMPGDSIATATATGLMANSPTSSLR